MNLFNEGISLGLIATETGAYVLILSSIFLLNFLVNKNKLSHKNGYEILIYSLLLAILPISMQFMDIVCANFFILLALRRIMSLRSNIVIKKKLFDAAFWIGIASLFYFWAILFFVLIIFAMLIHSVNNFKNWIIPFLGIIAVGILSLSYTVLVEDSFGMLADYLEVASFDFSYYSDLNFIYVLSVLGGLGLLALLFYILQMNQRPKAQRGSHLLVIIAFCIGLAIILIVPEKNGSEYLFIFSPLTIIISNYLEGIKRQWIAEVFVWILILTPVSLLML